MGVVVALALLVLAAASVRLFLTTPPARLAGYLRKAGPIALIGGGAGLTLMGRAAAGLPLGRLGIAALRRFRSTAPPATDTETGASSTVRSLWLSMSLDHDTGELDGEVLGGDCAGRFLSDLSAEELIALRSELSADPESLRLLEAYLDRRVPGWRGDAKAQARDGLGGAPGAGPMTEQQAHEILGLESGATLAEIREAHRRLMKRVHPDHGGSDFLAARINEAKAFLVERHR